MKIKKLLFKFFTASLIFLASLKLCASENSYDIEEKPMVIVIPSYNNIKWYEKNLSILVAQKYNNWRAIYIDDCSTDGTGNAVEKYIKDNNLEDKIILVKNPQNMGAMYNMYHAVHTCKNDEIVVCLDGDDWFADDQVLEHVNKVYNDGKTWITYGRWIAYPDPNKLKCRAEELPDFAIKQNLFRSKQYYWTPSALRTFYAGLFKKIKKEDLMKDGKFFTICHDPAIMFPMLEMAGFHLTFIPKILYVYNQENPISDSKVRLALQREVGIFIRNKEKYSRIDAIN
jgi:glycosyltransferase involved in cell wall biosynthesis